MITLRTGGRSIVAKTFSLLLAIVPLMGKTDDIYDRNNIDISYYVVKQISYLQLSPMGQTNALKRVQKVLKKFPDLDDAIVQTDIPQPLYHSPGKAYATHYQTRQNKSDLKALGVEKKSITISGTIKDDQYLIENNNACIHIPECNKKLAEGESFKGYVALDGTFEYTTVLGAHRRIRKYRYIYTENVTIEDLENYLNEDNTVFFQYQLAMKCPACGGQGGKFEDKVEYNKEWWEGGRPRRKHRKHKTFVECSECKGKKKVQVAALIALSNRIISSKYKQKKRKKTEDLQFGESPWIE